MKPRMTIGKKLMLSFGLVLAVGGTIASVSLWTIKGLNARFDTAVSKTARKLQLGSELDQIKSDMYVAQRGFVLATFMKDNSRAEAQRAEFDSQVGRMKQKLEDIHPLITVPAGRRLLVIFENDFTSWLNEYQTVLRLCESGSPDDAQRHSFTKIAPIYKDMTATGEQFVEVYRKVLEADKRAASQDYEQTLWVSFLSIGALATIGVTVFFIIRQMSGNLRQIAAEMADGADQVAAAAGQVSSSSQSLAQGASEQAASIEQTSASSEQINSMSRKNAESSKVAAENMENASMRIGEANRNLEQMVESMNEINASSDKISKIIKVIDEIAFQTNILALNAAVEAARAGEAGMGFAVVADEVRHLAQRCAQAAKDTARLIEESIAKSTDGKSKLGKVAAAVSSITESAGKVKTLVDEVKVGSEEQSRGIEQVAKAITQMEKVTQTTAANAEESASASEELSAQSDTLRAVVARLNGMVGGGGVENGAHHAGCAPAAGRRPGGAEPGPASPKNVSPQRGAGSHGVKVPVMAPVHAGNHEIPLEHDFKEF
jgi:methyl-accepting chemotaxis protein